MLVTEMVTLMTIIIIDTSYFIMMRMIINKMMTKLTFVVVIVAVGAGVVVGVAAVVCAAGNTMCICLAGHNGPSNDLHSRAGQRPSPSSCVCVSVSPNYKAARVGRITYTAAK